LGIPHGRLDKWQFFFCASDFSGLIEQTAAHRCVAILTVGSWLQGVYTDGSRVSLSDIIGLMERKV
jgi:hypothetical protein